MRELLRELQDPETSDASSIEFEEDGSGDVHARFHTEDGRFKVSFARRMLPWMGKDHRLLGNFKSFEISFYSPTGHTKLTSSSKNPARVYSRLMQAVRAFCDRYSPEILSFMPSDPGMNMIYKKFYERYLSRRYKLMHYMSLHNNVGVGYFIRNDLYDGIKDKIEAQGHESAWESDVRASAERKSSARRRIAAGDSPEPTPEPYKMPSFSEWVSARDTLQ